MKKEMLNIIKNNKKLKEQLRYYCLTIKEVGITIIDEPNSSISKGAILDYPINIYYSLKEKKIKSLTINFEHQIILDIEKQQDRFTNLIEYGTKGFKNG
jgi:hypothetical protein